MGDSDEVEKLRRKLSWVEGELTDLKEGLTYATGWRWCDECWSFLEPHSGPCYECNK